MKRRRPTIGQPAINTASRRPAPALAQRINPPNNQLSSRLKIQWPHPIALPDRKGPQGPQEALQAGDAKFGASTCSSSYYSRACWRTPHYEPAEESFSRLGTMFTTSTKSASRRSRRLSESMSALPHPADAAERLKRVLQSVFEASYAFDPRRSQEAKLGPRDSNAWRSIRDRPFTVGYVTPIGSRRTRHPARIAARWNRW